MCFLSYAECRFKKQNEKQAVGEQLGVWSRDKQEGERDRSGCEGWEWSKNIVQTCETTTKKPMILYE